MELDAEPTVADAQMRAVIFYLTTFGHIDGEFEYATYNDPQRNAFFRGES